MKWLWVALLLAGCHRSAQMHAHAGVSVTVSGQIAPELECNQIDDAEARKVCLKAVDDQKKVDQEKRRQ
jgi:hypothetical protein